MFKPMYIASRAKVGESKTYVFKYVGNGTIRILSDGTQDITKSTCGCQVQSYNTSTREISIIITPKPVPLNRTSKGYTNYDKTTQVTVVFMENNTPKQYILTIQLDIHE